MANTCTTTYKVTGTRKAVNDLWTVLQKMEVNSKNVWLHQLADYYGIDYEKKGISARGHIYWEEFEADEVNDYYLLSFETESAWSACDELFDEINHVLWNELSISYREIECGCNIYFVHDEGEYFTEECCVSSCGEPFEDACDDVYGKPTLSRSGAVRPASSREIEARKKWLTSSMNTSMMTPTHISTSTPSHLNSHWK